MPNLTTIVSQYALSLLAGTVCLVAGCGQPGKVSGVVTLDGAPLSTGVITFNPAVSGPSAYGAIGADGRYELRTGATAGLAAGEYVVTVAANAAAQEQPGAGSWPGTERVLPLVTPRKYADREKTPLRATVKAGGQKLDFALVSE
jgi:hypothetical protein